MHICIPIFAIYIMFAHICTYKYTDSHTHTQTQKHTVNNTHIYQHMRMRISVFTRVNACFYSVLYVLCALCAAYAYMLLITIHYYTAYQHNLHEKDTSKSINYLQGVGLLKTRGIFVTWRTWYWRWTWIIYLNIKYTIYGGD